MRDSRNADPDKPIFPLCGDPSIVVTGRNLDIPNKAAVVDLHGDYAHWFGDYWKGRLLLVQGLRRLSISLDTDSASVNFYLNILFFDTSQFNAYSYARGALKHVDMRMPLGGGFLKLCEVNLRDLIGNFTKLILDEAQAERAGFSVHGL
jgi:hypothetical protein